MLLSELDSNKHRTLPKSGDLPISRSLMPWLTLVPNPGIEPKFTIYKIVVLTVVLIRPNISSLSLYDLHGARTRTTTVKEWGANLLHKQIGKDSWTCR